MKTGKRSGLLLCAGLLASALLSGCGGSNTSGTIPSVATVYYAHTALFRNTTSLMTTGYNGFGQLGIGNLDTQTTLKRVVGLGGVMDQVATGADHTVALTFTNVSSVFAWGSNYYGQIGNAVDTTGTNAFSSKPVRIYFPAHVTAIAAGAFHTLAVVGGAGNVYAVGYNGFGQLGDGTVANSNVHVEVVDFLNGLPLFGIKQVAASGGHSLALTADGRVYGWGDNSNGQVGVTPDFPTTQAASYFTKANLVQVRSNPDVPTSALRTFGVPPDVPVAQIAAGGSTSFARKTDGTVWAWGYNGTDELGVASNLSATTDFGFTPVQVKGLLAGVFIKKISAGLGHVLALANDGSVYAWGLNNFSQLGDGTVSGDIGTPLCKFKPVKVLGPLFPNANPALNNDPATVATDIVAFGNQSFALVGGIWYGWGDNGYGQLANPISSSTIGYLPMTKLQGP